MAVIAGGPKQVVVVSDDSRLARAIELSLNRHLGVEIVHVPHNRQRVPDISTRECSLIIVAISSPTSEPVVALARSALVRKVGQVPLLIISERPFAPEPGARIAHLDFPFDFDRLHERVTDMLDAEAHRAPTRVAAGAVRP